MTEYTIHFASTIGHLRMFLDEDDPLLRRYDEARDEYENRSYEASLRTLGLCCELLSERAWQRSDIDKNLPDQTGSRIKGLRNNELGPATFIGELIGPVWWLRCEVAHADGYDIGEEETAIAHHLFRVAIDTYREAFTD